MNVILDTFLSLVLKVFQIVFNLLFSWVNLPKTPSSLSNAVNTYLNYIFDNLSVLNFFIRISTLKTIFKIFLIIYIFKYTFKLILFIVHKIPDVVSKWTQLSLFK